jgi:hypothetical protein
MTRHEIQILRAVGMAQAAVAVKTGTSERSVRRIERETPVATSDTAALVRARGLGRPSIAAPWTERIAQWLAEENGDLPGVELLRRRSRRPEWTSRRARFGSAQRPAQPPGPRRGPPGTRGGGAAAGSGPPDAWRWGGAPRPAHPAGPGAARHPARAAVRRRAAPPRPRCTRF